MTHVLPQWLKIWYIYLFRHEINKIVIFYSLDITQKHRMHDPKTLPSNKNSFKTRN